MLVESLLAFGIRFPNVSLGALPKKKRRGDRRGGRERRNKERKKF